MKTWGKRVLSVGLSAMLLVSAAGLSAFAADETETVKIKNATELADAIAAQADGQVWELAAGTYDLTEALMAKYADKTINGESKFVFPIVADNLTIKGTGDVLITSSFDPGAEQGGVWHNQNFVTVSGEKVTIENVDLKANPNAYYDGSCNKVLELVDGGKDLTLKDVDVVALTDANDKKFGGSIYVNVADAGTTTLENVTMSAWISAKAVTTGKVVVKNVVQDFTDNAYAGYSDPTYGYAWNPGVSGDKVDIQSLTIQVDENVNLNEQVIKGLKSNTTIELDGDIQVDEEVYIKDVDGITVKGNGHTITASENFKMNIEGQIQLFKVENGENLTLENVKLVGTDKTKHCLDVYAVENLVLKDVTLNHENASTGAPLVINGSTVAVEGALNLVTGANSWYGINVDDKNGDAAISFAEGSSLKMDNKSEDEKIVIYAQTSDENKDPQSMIQNPENAGIAYDKNGAFVEATPVTSITLDKTSATLKVGEELQLQATVKPEDASYPELTWTSSDDKVVTVDANGKIKAVAAGTAKITVTCADGVKAECTVTVEAATSSSSATESTGTTATTGTQETQPDDPGKTDTGVQSYVWVALLLMALAVSGLVITAKRVKANG